jgi:GNAT superfamily N-acetyltransferase
MSQFLSLVPELPVKLCPRRFAVWIKYGRDNHMDVCMNGWMLTSPFSHRTHLQLRRIIRLFRYRVQRRVLQECFEAKNEEMSKFAHWNGYVGSRFSQVEPVREGAEERLYIGDVGCLAAYRGRGIGKQPLKSIFEYTETNSRWLKFRCTCMWKTRMRSSFTRTSSTFKQGEMIDYYRRGSSPLLSLVQELLNGGSAFGRKKPSLVTTQKTNPPQSQFCHLSETLVRNDRVYHKLSFSLPNHSLHYRPERCPMIAYITRAYRSFAFHNLQFATSL